jgi:hypothetical protein
VSFAANLVFAYGLATLVRSRLAGVPWGLSAAAHDVSAVLWATLPFALTRVAVRCACVARVYGWKFGSFVPLRIIWANWINCLATVSALARYAAARLRKQPLAWVKTEHLYPSHAALAEHKQRLGEVLVRTRLISGEQLVEALQTQPAHLRLGEHLVSLGWLSENQLYQGLSLQQNVSFAALEPEQVPVRVARALPAEVVRRCKVLPFRVDNGKLYVAGPELPDEDLQTELRRFTRLEVRFQFITPSNLARLEHELLGPERVRRSRSGPLARIRQHRVGR